NDPVPGNLFWFREHFIIPVDLSEPRDMLQSERTLLGFVRFALTLSFTAIGLILGFHLKSRGAKNGSDVGPRWSLFNQAVPFFLAFLALATLATSIANYFQTVKRYSRHRIQNSGPKSALLVVCVTAVVVTLAGLNISLTVER
ncbi:hypothetical protein METBIDRAFT_15140, partial [Metschnikowia bicuspidata var. bicuspidata NRRL YB-4993]